MDQPAPMPPMLPLLVLLVICAEKDRRIFAIADRRLRESARRAA